jgi:hypothetical protein
MDGLAASVAGPPPVGAHVMTDSSTQQLLDYLAALLGPADDGRLLEVRVRRRAGGMQQSFYSSRSLAEACSAILAAGQRTDVYVGVVPRDGQAGGKKAISSVSTLWVDCDDPRAAQLLAAFRPAPAIVVASGPTGRHAYWLLDEALTPDQAEIANRRLAHVLGADPQSTDAARILRPPGTLNFKYGPPATVELERFCPERVAASTVAGPLPEPAPVAPPVPLRYDALREIEPAVFVRVLLGVDVPRSRKVLCPFHRDDSPSLHVYETGERGWYCFGCGRGGSIYDLAAGAVEPRHERTGLPGAARAPRRDVSPWG